MVEGDIRTQTVEIREVLSELSYSMMISGYTVGVRLDIIRGVLERTKVVEGEIRRGERQRFRNRKEIEEQKDKDKNRHTNTWYLRGGMTGVLKVQPTPNSELCKMVRAGIEELRNPDGGRTKVIEMGGMPIMAGIGVADPFRIIRCPFEEKCWVGSGVDCWKTRVVYRIVCGICGAEYTGTTGTSLHKRTITHMEAVKRGDRSNPISKHFLIEHREVRMVEGGEAMFSVKILGSRSVNMERYIEEGVWIEEAVKMNKVSQMNSKGEWGRVNTRRITVQDHIPG